MDRSSRYQEPSPDSQMKFSDSVEEDDPHDAAHQDGQAQVDDRERPQIRLDAGGDENWPDQSSSDRAADRAEKPAREICASDIDHGIASGEHRCRREQQVESE